MNRIDAINPVKSRRDLPPFRAGDTVRVHVNITEGDKQRIQVFEGVVLRRRGGGPSATFTVRKVSYGVGVERVFPIESPNVTRVEIKSRGHVRRARLYYLRDLRGKKARLRSKVRDLSGLISEEEADRQAGTAAAASEVGEIEVVPPAPEEDAAEASAEEAAAEGALTVACGILLAWPARIAGALRFTSAEGHPRSGFLQVLTPGARPDNSEGSVSEP
jgi:large subunit ribosomal protein L19